MQTSLEQFRFPPPTSRPTPSVGPAPATDPERQDAQVRIYFDILQIAAAEAARTQPTRRRSELARSALARQTQAPEIPTLCVAPRRAWRAGLLRLVRPVIILIFVALILFGAKAGHDWFAAHFAFDALKPDPHPDMYEPYYSHDPVVAAVQRGERAELYSLPPHWYWVLLPGPFATDPFGQSSYWTPGRNKGSVKSQRDLPLTGQLGDEYHIASDGTNWIWMVAFGATAPSWVDP